MSLMLRTVFISVLAFLYSTSNCFALPKNSKEKLIILSDTTLYDNKTGITIFEGHVKATQGRTLLTADRLTTKAGKDHKINEIIAFGTTHLAEFWTFPEEKSELFHASASIIKYYPKELSVTLLENVTATQGKNSFHGGVIHYNRLTETLEVPASNTGRAVLIYNPDSKSNL